jgi:hypothetical protein
MRLNIVQRFRRSAAPDLWQLGVDAREVMLARISRGLTGRLSAAETRRMVLEKQSAGIRAHYAYMQWLFSGQPAAANQAVFDIYHRAVRSNRKRLSRRRWPWLMG